MRYLSVCSGIEAATRHMQDMTGRRNGKLVVVGYAGRREKDGRALWHCACDCGGQRTVAQNNLTREAGTKSCGCLRQEAAARRIRENGVWNDGKSYAIEEGTRCYKTRHAWAKAAVRAFGNKCQICGWSEGRCDVHHRQAKASGGLHTLENAIVICPNCHRVQHERSRG